MKLFTLEQTLDILISFSQAMCPEEFKSSKGLSSIDFFDAPICKAKQLGIEKEFKKAEESYKKHPNKYKIPDCISTDNIYVLIQWPESQEYMEEEWFDEEVVLETEGNFGGSAYFIPFHRIANK